MFMFSFGTNLISYSKTTVIFDLTYCKYYLYWYWFQDEICFISSRHTEIFYKYYLFFQEGKFRNLFHDSISPTHIKILQYSHHFIFVVQKLRLTKIDNNIFMCRILRVFTFVCRRVNGLVTDKRLKSCRKME